MSLGLIKNGGLVSEKSCVSKTPIVELERTSSSYLVQLPVQSRTDILDQIYQKKIKKQ